MKDDQGVKVILNGTVVSLPREISFEKLIKIAFPDVVQTELIEWEVDYKYADDKEETRELTEGKILEVAREMEIYVSYTDKS